MSQISFASHLSQLSLIFWCLYPSCNSGFKVRQTTHSLTCGLETQLVRNQSRLRWRYVTLVDSAASSTFYHFAHAPYLIHIEYHDFALTCGKSEAVERYASLIDSSTSHPLSNDCRHNCSDGFSIQIAKQI